MPIPPPPPPPAPPLGQAGSPPRLGGNEPSSGRGALLSDICRGTRLKKVAVVNDRSAPLLDSKSTSTAGQTPPTDHPYIRLYQYLHQNQLKQQGAPGEEEEQQQQQQQQQQQRTVATEQSSTHCLNKPKGVATNGSTAVSPPGSSSSMAGLFPGGVSKLRPVADGSASRSPVARGAAPRPPVPARSPSPPPPPAVGRRGTAPSPPTSSAYNRDKPLPPAPGGTPPLPSKPPPSPGSNRRPPTSGGNPPASPSPSSSLAPPPLLYRGTNGPAVSDTAPELPQRHNSLGSKRMAPSPTPGGPAPTRGPAPPPPPSPIPHQQGSSRPAPPLRDGSTRGPAPAVPAIQSSRGGARGEAPPLPPYRTHGSPSLSSDPPARGKPPPPPPTRTPAAPPPPPPPLRNGHHSPSSSSSSTPRSFVDDFESKYSFHSLDDFPPPDEYRHFAKIYPSKANRVMRGAPPLPPVGR